MSSPKDTDAQRAPGRAGTVPYNDLDLRRWKDYEDVWTDSLWIIPARARGDGHQLEYHGNFVPQIATQVFQRYTRRGEVVLDLFLGSGTSAIEAVRLERRCLGVELQERMIEHVGDRLPEAVRDGRVALLQGDSTQPETHRRVAERMQAAWGQSQADLVMLHPPYGNIIQFCEDPADLSNCEDTEAFLQAFSRVAAAAFELLKPGRFAVLVIGDTYQKGELTPLGFLCLQQLNEAGFRTKSIVVKNIVGNEIAKGRAGNLWRYRALKGGFYIFKHEYVMVFRKP